jgi:hypothetical protein
MDEVTKRSAFFAWAMADMEWRHGASSAAELLLRMRSFDATAEVGKIKARTLVIDGEDEEYGQAKALFDALTCPKDYLKFSAKDTASLHVQVGALAFSTSRILDWVERNL